MQKEAEQRVREMQSRARLIGEEDSTFPRQKNVFPQSKNPPAPPQNPVASILGGMDNDKLIILAILWILWNEHADNKLILALLYLLL